MEDKVYKFKFSKRVISLGLLQIAIAAVFAYLLYVFYEGGYLSVWFITFVLALIALLIFSIPRRTVVTSSQIKIFCVLELTEINIADIVKVRKVNPRSMRWVMPLFASYGFFGYYGIFFDWQHADRIKMYTTEWQNLVEIVDIYEDKYYISCRHSDAFVKDVQRKRRALEEQ